MPLYSQIRRLALATSMGFAWALAAGCAWADDYPSKPIKLVVPYPPGSTTDNVARVVANEASKILGQPIVVDNKGGASGNIGAQFVARAAPDGYTLLMTSGSIHGINSALFRKLPYDPIADFDPITQFTVNSYILLVNKDVPVSSVVELIALAKKEPGKLNLGAGASSSQIAGAMFLSMAGIDMTYVGYKGNAQVMTDLMGGTIQVMVSDMSGGTPHYRAGAVKALATTGTRRAPAAPELPTLREAGIPGYEFSGWVGLVAPAKTPQPIIDKLYAAIRQAVKRPEVVRSLTAGGAEIVMSTPEEFSAFIKAEIERAVTTAKAAHIQPE